MPTFADKISLLQRSHNLTDDECARICEVSIPTWQRWKSGTTHPRPMIEEIIVSDLTRYRAFEARA